MLYDPKWSEQQTRAEPTVAGLIAWLRTQPAKTKYDYGDPNACLICRYLNGALGFTQAAYSYGNGYGERDGGIGSRRPLALELELISRHCPWTYGAALRRARKVLAEQR